MANPHVTDQLDAYIDGEFDMGTSLVIEKHLEACTQCRADLDQRRALVSILQRGATRYAAPDTLRRRVQRGIAQEVGARQRVLPLIRRWGSMVAGLLLVAGLSSAATAYFMRGAPTPSTEDEVVSSHVRSLLVDGRLTDVDSSDEHTVKPWFNHKLDFAPPVEDYTSRGFPLVGGRLDYIDRHTVAALVYRHRQHLINVFIWPEEGGRPRPVELMTRQGYAVVHWADGAMTYWAVSDVNAAELKEFCETLRLTAPKPS
jgi:anti-sigma factor RsiW